MTTSSPVGEKYNLVAEINMIPLIDVSLVLLIIFMVLTPVLVRSQIQVDLPEAESAMTPREEEQALVIEIDKTGVVSLDGTLIAVDELESALSVELRGRADRLVILEADRAVAFQHVVGVMDVAKKVGAGNLAVAALKD